MNLSRFNCDWQCCRCSIIRWKSYKGAKASRSPHIRDGKTTIRLNIRSKWLFCNLDKWSLGILLLYKSSSSRICRTLCCLRWADWLKYPHISLDGPLYDTYHSVFPCIFGTSGCLAICSPGSLVFGICEETLSISGIFSIKKLSSFGQSSMKTQRVWNPKRLIVRPCSTQWDK